MGDEAFDRLETISQLNGHCLQMLSYAKQTWLSSSVYLDNIYAACGNLAEVISYLCLGTASSDGFHDFGPEPMCHESAIEKAPSFFATLEKLLAESRSGGAEFPFAAVGVRAQTFATFLKFL